MILFAQGNLKNIIFSFCFLFFLNTKAQTITTIAGSTQGFTNGTGTAAQFNTPTCLVMDPSGNIYVSDRNNHCIRKITTAGVVTTFAGSGVAGYADGTGTLAQFNAPSGLAIDAAGNIFAADDADHRIRKITTVGVVTTFAGSGVRGFADGTGIAAQFGDPYGLAIDAAGNIYVGDQGNNRIRKITNTGVVTTFAGSGINGFADGIGTVAQFKFPIGVVVDNSGTVFVTDRANNRIRKISSTGVVTTLSGTGVAGFADGIGTVAQFNSPSGIAIDAAGNLFVTDCYNHRIRKITATGTATTLAGTGVAGFADGSGTIAKFNYPQGITVDSAGALFVADASNNRIRKITGVLATNDYLLENRISVYPNPTSSLITIELEDLIDAKMILFNVNGEMIQSQNLVNNKTTIDMNGLADNIYVIQITTDKYTIFKKVVKK